MSQLLAPRFQKERIHPQLSAYFMGIIGSVSYIDFYYLVLGMPREQSTDNSLRLSRHQGTCSKQRAASHLSMDDGQT
jgi:hypothetical protein